MRSKQICLLGLIILAAACQKRKYPEDKVQLEKEEVYCTGSVDGQPLSLKIGTDNYYCYASCQQNTDSIYVFQGDLKKYNCNPCPLALKVELSDYCQRAPGASVVVDSSLRTGSRGFITGVEKTNTLRFVSSSNKNVSSLRWQLSNGFSSQDPVMSYEFGQPGLQTVSLTILTTGNCESTVINKIFIGGETGFFACSISETSQNNLSVFTPSVIGGKQPYHYTWNFGDGGISSQAAPNHQYTWAGSYPVTLQVEDAEGHVCESNFIYVTGNDQSSCAANMSVSHQSSRNAFLNAVRIQWTDQSNTVLRSDSIAQPAGSYFEVLHSEPYAPNEKGEPGRLLTLRFNVLLSDGKRSAWFKTDNTAIAVSYK